MVCLLILFLAVGALLSFRTYESVRGPLQRAQATLTGLAHNPSALDSDRGRNEAERTLLTVTKEISTARNEIRGSIGLTMLGIFPGLHTQGIALEQLVSDLETTTQSSSQLLQAVNTLAAHSHGTDVSIPDLSALGEELGHAHKELAGLERPIGGLWGPIGAYRQRFDREDARAVTLLGEGIDLTRYALPFVGADGPRTYLVMGENNAEMRDQGSPLSYSTMTASDGHLTIFNGGSIGPIEPTGPVPGVTVPPGTAEEFSDQDLSMFLQNADATADFPFTGSDLQTIFAAETGQHVNGVIALDVPALQSLLALTGPVSVPSIPEPVTAANAAVVLLHQLYEDVPYGSQVGRHEELGAVTSAAIHQLETGNVDVVALVRTLAADTAERHLLVWDQVPQYEQVLTDVGASGSIDTDDPSRTFHVAVENATMTKLDYYLTVSVAQDVQIQPNGDAVIDTAVTLHNGAPSGVAPSYQLGPDGLNSKVEGQYVGRVFLWGPRGSEQSGAIPESGLSLNPEQDISVLAGQSATVHFHTTIPNALQNGRFTLNFVPQPRLAPEQLNVLMTAVGRTFTGPANSQVALSKNDGLNWTFLSGP